MHNRDIQAALRYHNGSKHPNGDLFSEPEFVEIEDDIPLKRPLVLFKRYPGLSPIPLSLDAEPAQMAALDAIATRIASSTEERVPDIQTLAKILHFSAGITKRITYFGQKDRPFRAALCTGALYHIEMYVVCGDLPGLGPGVYHFDIEGSLKQLRAGDYRAVLADAAGFGGSPGIGNPPVSLVYTDVFWRNAQKYDAREYRHAFWDCGTILANTLAISTACGTPAHVITGFADDVVNQLLGLDSVREAAIAVVSLGSGNSSDYAASPSVGPLSLETFPDADGERIPAPITDIHAASSLNKMEASLWRIVDPLERQDRERQKGLFPLDRKLFPLDLGGPDEIPQDLIEPVIVRRGSTRRFARTSISFRELSLVLKRPSNPVPADFLSVVGGPGAPLNDIYLIINDVEGMASGSYVFHREEGALEKIAEGDFREEAQEIAVDQCLAGEASVTIYFLCDLDPILEKFGNRGYRAAQFDASITAGRMYLAAYAQKLGATGLTFLDDDVTDFFSPHASGKSAMFLLALGKRARKTSDI